MDKTAIKNKFITVFVMSTIITILFLSSYILFLQESKVDVTKNITLQYSGESGNASLKVVSSKVNYNQRKQEFMDSITYQVSDNENLKNGDVITIEANYDKQLATTYHLKVINEKKTIVVEGLAERIEGVKTIPYAFLLDVNEAGQNFFTKHNEEIIHDHFIMFDDQDEIRISNNRLLHRLFLKSKNSHSDRISDIYQISAKGSMMDDEGKLLKDCEYSIYYMLTYDKINDAFMIYEENVYGEKLITKQEELSEDEILALLKDKYQKDFDIETIY